MNAQTFVDDVREDNRTALDRLASEKALLAVTGADISSEGILGTVASSLAGLQTTVEEWAAESTDPATRDLFEGTAASLEAQHERTVGELDGDPGGNPPVPIPTVGTFEDPVERVGAAFVGHGLVFDGVLLQAVSFFVNEAETRRADLMRDLRSAASDRVDDGASTLDSLCAGDTEWSRAESAVTQVIDAAYDDYAETLDRMGIDPKPVC